MTLDRMKIKAVMQIIMLNSHCKITTLNATLYVKTRLPLTVVDIGLLLAWINLMTKQQVGVDSNEI